MVKRIITGTMVALCLSLTGCASSENQEPQKTTPNIMSIQVRAEQAYKMARLDESESLYHQVLTSLPNYAPAWFRLGNIYTRTGRQEAAINAYKRCIDLEPSNKKALYNMSLVYIKQSTQVLDFAANQGEQNSPMSRQIQLLLNALHELQGEGGSQTASVEQVAH